MQFISAGIVTGIPSQSSVVEVDAQDGKNIFYLPKGTDYTAVMSPGTAAMLCSAVLCCAMLFYAMLCYAMLCYAMLCYAMLCYAMLCYAMLCYAM